MKCKNMTMRLYWQFRKRLSGQRWRASLMKYNTSVNCWKHKAWFIHLQLVWVPPLEGFPGRRSLASNSTPHASLNSAPSGLSPEGCHQEFISCWLWVFEWSGLSSAFEAGTLVKQGQQPFINRSSIKMMTFIIPEPSVAGIIWRQKVL